MGKRRRKSKKSKYNNPIGFRFIFMFFVFVFGSIFAIIFAFRPLHDIPILDSIVGDNYAYTTPIMLFNEFLPVIIIILGSTVTIFILYIIKKYF